MWVTSMILILLILSGTVGGLAISAKAAHGESGAGVPARVQDQGETLAGSPPIQEQKIVLPPFFRLQRKDSTAWVERIIVTFTMALPQDSLKHDLNSPTFRKLVYDLLLSGESEPDIQARALAGLERQLGIDVDAAVQVTRSVMIVR